MPTPDEEIFSVGDADYGNTPNSDSPLTAIMNALLPDNVIPLH